MSRSTRVPSYRRHKQSGQAVVTLTDGMGGRHDVLLGKYGTATSRHEYARVLAEWEAAGRTLVKNAATAADVTVNEVIVRFWQHAEEHYRHPDGTPTGELNDYRLSLKPLKELYGHTLAREFGPLALKAIRQKMIESGLCRGVVNQRVGRVRRMFRWAVEQEMVPGSVLHALQAVRGLQRGRSAARETEPVRPVPEEIVLATLPCLQPPVAAMVRLQLYTGMRPGEATIMRGIDLDMTGKVWMYRPGSDQGPHGQHKTAHRGHRRVVPIGPRGQLVIREFLKTDLCAYLFSPRDAMTKFWAAQRKRQPKQVAGRRRKPRKQPGNRYLVRSYAQAIRLACKRAVPFGWHPPLAVGVPHWHPHQLRHTKATELRRVAGLDAARVILGHRSPQVTEVYAELDEAKAAEVMARLG
jgi:integrase